jgi:hypothetical protein
VLQTKHADEVTLLNEIDDIQSFPDFADRNCRSQSTGSPVSGRSDAMVTTG